MNSEEGMSMAKMAVTVLLVVLVIGAVVAIVYAAYSWFGSGTAKLTDSVTSIEKSAYSQFDDAQVSGSDVLSALKTYREADIAVVISNNNNGGYQSGATSCNGRNYCALIGAQGTTPTPDADNAYPVTIYQGNGKWYTSAVGADGKPSGTAIGLCWSDDRVTLQRNTNFSPTTTNGNSNCFVKTSAKWYANLIYDTTTDDVCGILFRQMS